MFFEKVKTIEAIICLDLLELFQDWLHYFNISHSGESKHAFVNSVNFQGRMVSFTNPPFYPPAIEH
jgi:hypothetical protein